MQRWLLSLLATSTACGLQSGLPSSTADTAAQLNAFCEEVEPAFCGEEPGCTPIVGRPLRASFRLICYDAAVPLEFVGCRASAADCGLALAFAQDESGAYWWFPDRCLPPQFRVTEEKPGDCD